MGEYRVIWEIDISADSPIEAAIEAQKDQTRVLTTAEVFDVFDERGEKTRVDLTELRENDEVAVGVQPQNVMYEALLRTQNHYFKLHDLMSDCVENGHFTENDHEKLADQLEICCGVSRQIEAAIKKATE